jgi:hypothetical protein
MGATTIGKKTDRPFDVIGIGSVIKVKPLPATQREYIGKEMAVVAVLACGIRRGGEGKEKITTRRRRLHCYSFSMMSVFILLYVTCLCCVKIRPLTVKTILMRKMQTVLVSTR